jgi:hypothetical protein
MQWAIFAKNSESTVLAACDVGVLSDRTDQNQSRLATFSLHQVS